jgi:hypothetical protein
MNDYRSWRPIYQAMCPEPGPRDMFVVTLINGRRMGVYTVDAYAQLRRAAEQLAEQHQCHVKLLPMAGNELLRFLGILPAPPQSIDNMDPAFRRQAVTNCMDVIRESAEPREREEAVSLLRVLGALQ